MFLLGCLLKNNHYALEVLENSGKEKKKRTAWENKSYLFVCLIICLSTPEPDVLWNLLASFIASLKCD